MATFFVFFREEPFYDIQLNVKGKKDSEWLISFNDVKLYTFGENAELWVEKGTKAVMESEPGKTGARVRRDWGRGFILFQSPVSYPASPGSFFIAAFFFFSTIWEPG